MTSATAQEVSDKRIYPRYTCTIPVPNKQLVCNMSLGGLFLESNRRYTLGQDLSLNLTLPTEKKRIKFSGKVVRHSHPNGEISGYGVQFDQLDSELTGKLKKFLVNQDAYLKVETIFHELVGAEMEDLDKYFNREASIANDLCIDSLKVAELSLLLEDSFKQDFFLPDWLTSKNDPSELTIGSLVDYLVNQSGAVH